MRLRFPRFKSKDMYIIIDVTPATVVAFANLSLIVKHVTLKVAIATQEKCIAQYVSSGLDYQTSCKQREKRSIS